jgi:hypothetical protein
MTPRSVLALVSTGCAGGDDESAGTAVRDADRVTEWRRGGLTG